MRGLIFDFRILLHMHVFVCASKCEFGDEILLRGEECKTRENLKFSKMVK